MVVRWEDAEQGEEWGGPATSSSDGAEGEGQRGDGGQDGRKHEQKRSWRRGGGTGRRLRRHGRPAAQGQRWASGAHASR